VLDLSHRTGVVPEKRVPQPSRVFGGRLGILNSLLFISGSVLTKVKIPALSRKTARQGRGTPDLVLLTTLLLRSTSRRSRVPDRFTRQHQFHATVLLPAFRRFVGGDWLGLAESARVN
jgi:hypothetical protein